MFKPIDRVFCGATVMLALAAASPAVAQGPGTPPIAGATFTLKLRENFQIPAPQEPGVNPPFVTPVPVLPGFVVLKDDPQLPNDDFKNWSDIIYFDFQDQNHRNVFFISDPHGRPYADSDLQPYGISLSQILGDTRTVYLDEKYPATQYVTGGQPGFGIATYLAYSDVDTLSPGTPLTSGQGFSLDIREACHESSPEPYVVVNLPSPVQPGFLVLHELNPTTEAISEDNTKWSDVVYFRSPAAGGPATQAVLISDPSPPPGGVESGITDADLAGLGLHVIDIQEGNTVYTKEVVPVTYNPVNPAGVEAVYHVYSDAERIRITVIDWTTIQNLVRFQFRVENVDPNCPSDPIHLVASSQMFGVFNPDFGPIGQADVGPLDPAGGMNSFFDVFFDVPLSMLPPSAQKSMPMMLFTPGPTTMSALSASYHGPRVQTGCPPDNHWDGNVDIMWTGTGGGQVNKHFGTLQVCPGMGDSWIHLITGCSSTSTVTITGVCPGFTVKLLNNDLTPAPSPLPPGWDGKIAVSADASVPLGTTCCFQVIVTCGGATGTIDMCVTTCDCRRNPPGTPPAGVNFTMNLREAFQIPANRNEPAQFYQLPAPVDAGYVVLKDDPIRPDQDTQNWSDIVAFRQNAGGGSTAILLSDPPEGGFTDAQLSQYGITISQITGGNTVYLPELRVTRYVATDQVKGTATYFIYSDVDTLLPGTPLNGQGGFNVVLEEPPDPQETIVQVGLPSPVQPGFVVLLDDSTGSGEAALEDTTKWSDILYFRDVSPTAPPSAILISDRPNAAGVENGMNSNDLQPLGLTIFDVLEGNTVYLRERAPTIYDPSNPATGLGAEYRIFSDPSETGVPPTGARSEFGIRKIAPNPTSTNARIDFVIPRAASARLVIYDVAGQRVRTMANRVFEPGAHSLTWDLRGDDGRLLRTGAYFAKLVWEGKTATRTVLLLK
jgi:hypothetical protein